MSKVFYRFRTINNLINNYKELENQSIYFAHPEQLNDPMEGFRDVYWSGDLIIWKNLFRHYLLCLERLCSLLLISGEDHPISKTDMPIFYGENDFPTPQYKKLFSKIIKRFFGNQNLTDLIHGISSRSTPIRRDELFFYLRTVHQFALETIYSEYEIAGFIPSRKKQNNSADIPIKHLIEKNYIDMLEKSLIESKSEDKLANVLFSVQRNSHNQMDIIYRYNGVIDKDKKNRNLVLVEFPEQYISQLEKLVFPDWYTACFMSERSISNSSVWGHYGDKHSGVCLVFKSEEKEDSYYLNLKGIIGHGSSGPLYGNIKLKFQSINYIKGYRQIDFFRSLGRLPRPTLNSVWYTDENGKRSVCSDDIFNSEDKWRKKYWENFNRDILVKSKDWEYENEDRLILSSSLDSFSEEKSRVLKYDFASLEGLIFGIKTKIEDKLKVIKIIEAKCNEINRKNFKFYQAYYSFEDKCIKHSEMSLLKFNNKRNQQMLLIFFCSAAKI